MLSRALKPYPPPGPLGRRGSPQDDGWGRVKRGPRSSQAPRGEEAPYAFFRRADGAAERFEGPLVSLHLAREVRRTEVFEEVTECAVRLASSRAPFRACR